MNTVRAFTLLFFLLSGGASVAYATEYGDVGVTLQSPSPGQSSHGYAEYRVSVVNRSAIRRHVVRLNLPDPRVAYGGIGELAGISRTVVVEPGSTAQVSLWQPCLPLNGPGGLGVEIDGRLMRESVPGTAAQQGVAGNDYRSPLFLQSQGINKTGLQGLFTDALKTLSDAAKSAQEEAAEASAAPASAPTGILAEIVPLLSYNSSLAFSFAVAETSVTEWSANWLSYSRYDAILLTGDELRDSPPPVRAALWRMVEAGGALFVLGTGEPPPEWRFRKRAVGGLTVCDAGFGQCVFANPSKIADVTPADWFALWKLAQAPQEFWAPYPTVQEANEKFPVIEKLAIPLRGLFLLILIFTLVIGPANFLILRKLNRRLWLLWTVPAFSLLTSAGVAVYALFSEGFTAYERVAAFTVLNEPARQATTIGVVAYYSTLTPGDGLHFGAETELTTLTSPYSDGGAARTLDWTSDQHLQQGWISARIPTHFHVRKSEARRERLDVQYEPDGSVVVLNGLGAPIRRLSLRARDGKAYQAENVAPGARVALTLQNSATASAAAAPLRDLLVREWLTQAENFSQNPQLLLSPNTYLAVLDGTPFIEGGLANAQTRGKQNFVYGLIREGRDEN
jgi:hypothetical protein